MNIIINDERYISSIQEEFHEVFPFLKLEFFSQLHEPGQGNGFLQVQPSNKKLGEIRKIDTAGEIIITPKMTVAQLEQAFGKTYGLGVQVFRKSGKSWLETVLTDHWSLYKQNAEGEFLNSPIAPDEPEDYHEQE